jgi:hypothetical protein
MLASVWFAIKSIFRPLYAQLVENGGFARIVKSNDDDFQLLVIVPQAPEPGKPGTLQRIPKQTKS